MITVNDSKIKWSLLSETNEIIDNFNITYTNINFINIVCTSNSDPNSRILFKGIIQPQEDKSFNFFSITINEYNLPISVGKDLFKFVREGNYYISGDLNIKIFPTMCNQNQ